MLFEGGALSNKLPILRILQRLGNVVDMIPMVDFTFSPDKVLLLHVSSLTMGSLGLLDQ